MRESLPSLPICVGIPARNPRRRSFPVLFGATESCTLFSPEVRRALAAASTKKGGASLGLLRRRGSPVFGERDFGDEPGCLDRLRGFFRHAADLAFLAGVDVRRPEPGGKFHFGRRRRVHEGQHEGVLVVPGVMVRDDRQPTLARRVFPLVPPLEAERPGLRTRHDRMRAVYFCR